MAADLAPTWLPSWHPSNPRRPSQTPQAPFLPYGAFMLPGMMGGAFGVADGEAGKGEGEDGGEVRRRAGALPWEPPAAPLGRSSSGRHVARRQLAPSLHSSLSSTCPSPPILATEQDDDTEDDGGEDDEDDYSSGKEGGRPKRKRATRGAGRKKGDADAKSTSTALAMLASAAGTKPGVPGVINPAAAAMQQSIEGMWALNGGAGAMPATGSQLDLSKLTTAEQQQLLAAGEYTVSATRLPGWLAARAGRAGHPAGRAVRLPAKLPAWHGWLPAWPCLPASLPSRAGWAPVVSSFLACLPVVPLAA